MAEDMNRPNIVLVMSDDQGWGQTGYYDHPILETPELDVSYSVGPESHHARA
jgi:arylsulfatase A-like enzyme